MLTWANSLMAKNTTRSNIFLNGKTKKKDLKFVSTNISVSFLRSFSRYAKIVSGKRPNQNISRNEF